MTDALGGVADARVGADKLHKFPPKWVYPVITTYLGVLLVAKMVQTSLKNRSLIENKSDHQVIHFVRPFENGFSKKLGPQTEQKQTRRHKSPKRTENEVRIEAQSRLLQDALQHGKSKHIKNILWFGCFWGFVALRRAEEVMQVEGKTIKKLYNWTKKGCRNGSWTPF